MTGKLNRNDSKAPLFCLSYPVFFSFRPLCKRLGITVFQPRLKSPYLCAHKNSYEYGKKQSNKKPQSLLERYKQALIKEIPKAEPIGLLPVKRRQCLGHHYIVLATIHRRLTKLSKHPPLLNFFFFMAIREYRYAYCGDSLEKDKNHESARICTNIYSLYSFIFVIPRGGNVSIRKVPLARISLAYFSRKAAKGRKVRKHTQRLSTNQYRCFFPFNAPSSMVSKKL